ncbi:hypothetical protein AB0I77_34900 [Streptomyces sp. NPDC050619]|uniref:hypothetical protein n=1 Tax=Streptomyces sp. NPDC050619 TaxID=3157214 RepID=UPI00342CD2DC
MSSAARVLCLSLSLPLLVLLGSAAPAFAAGGWSLAPSGGGRPSFYVEGAPGAVLQDTVSVTNRGDRPITVRLYGTGVPIAFADRTVGVPARTRADVPFTVTVPAGDRAAEIVAHGADGGDRRIRLQLRATIPELSALTVEHVAVRGDRIAYELVNRGTTALAPKLAVRAEGLLGPVLDRAPRTLPVELPPGRRLRLTEPWPDRPALDAVDVRLTVTAAGGARDSAGTSARFVPWGAVAAGAGGAVVAVVGGFVVLGRRGRRRDDDGGASEPPRTEVELTGAMT